MYIQKFHHFCNTSSPDDGPKLGRSTWQITNYGRFINQFPPNNIRSIRQFERINQKLCGQKMSIMFNQICINEGMLPKYTYFKIYNPAAHKYNSPLKYRRDLVKRQITLCKNIYIYIYIYILSSSNAPFRCITTLQCG